MNKKLKYSLLFSSPVILLFFYFLAGIYFFNKSSKYEYAFSKIFKIPAMYINSKSIPLYLYIEDKEAIVKYFNYISKDSGSVLDEEYVEDRLVNKFLEEEIISDFARKNGIFVTEEEKYFEWEKQKASYGSDDEIKIFLTEAYGWSEKNFLDRVLGPFLLREKVEKFLMEKESLNDADLLAKATEIKTILDMGEKSFEDIAKEKSEDEYSSSNGGDIGYFERGTLDPYFEQAVFALEIGETSEPIKTSYGYHIIKLEDVLYGEDNNAKSARARHILVKGFDFEDWLEKQKSGLSAWRLVR